MQWLESGKVDLPCVHRAGLDAKEGWFLKRVSFRFLPYHRLSDEIFGRRALDDDGGMAQIPQFLDFRSPGSSAKFLLRQASCRFLLFTSSNAYVRRKDLIFFLFLFLFPFFFSSNLLFSFLLECESRSGLTDDKRHIATFQPFLDRGEIIPIQPGQTRSHA